jgi:uncharacterized cupin superfamily protein
VIPHWDEAETDRAELGHLAAARTDLSDATGARRLGVNRIQVDPGIWSTPARAEGGEKTGSGVGVMPPVESVGFLET